MNRRLLSSVLLLAVGFSCFALTAPPCLGAQTIDDLLTAATDPQRFNRQETLVLFYLAREVQHIAAVAPAEQNKPGTDQQVGALATSSGTTTLTEKSGLADLLNLAIERGAITKTTSGTSYTLQTTPYMVYSKLGANDNADTWKKYGYLTRIGISATFDQSSGDSSQTGSDFESGEIKYVALGNRSLRDHVDAIRADLFQGVQSDLNQVTGKLFAWANSLPAFNTADDKFQTELKAKNSWTVPQVEDLLAKSFKNVLNNLRAEDVAKLQELVGAIETEQKVRTSTLQAAIKKAQAILDGPGPQLSFSLGYQRDATTSDFSSVKVLYSYKSATIVSYNLNGEWDINNKLATNEGLALQRTRAYSVEGSLTAGKFANGSCDLTAAAKWSRSMDDLHSMVFAQAKLNLYLTRGVTIPIALTYANRTEQSNHSSLRFNAGFAINADTFLGVARKGTS